MNINKNIKFGISKSGKYVLYMIPKNHIDKHLERLKFYDVSYNVNYKVITRKDGLKVELEEVCFIFFSKIEKSLIDKLMNAYDFIDKREYSLPASNHIICFIRNNSYVITSNKKEEIEKIKLYFKQYKDVNYKIVLLRGKTIFIVNKNIHEAISEDIKNNINIINENDEEIIELQSLVNEYENIIGNKSKEPIFNFGGCIGYPRV